MTSVHQEKLVLITVMFLHECTYIQLKNQSMNHLYDESFAFFILLVVFMFGF